MPCDAHPETDFPIIHEVNIGNLLRRVDTMFLENQRIVLIGPCTDAVLIISMEPLRYIRQYQFAMRLDTKYWNGCCKVIINKNNSTFFRRDWIGLGPTLNSSRKVLAKDFAIQLDIFRFAIENF